MVELAIFGSLLLIVLTTLVSYGLNADYNQRVMMESFRESLAMANDSSLTGGGSYALTRDQYLPSPSNPFAIGQTLVVSSSGNVLRDFALQKTAETVEELPRSRLKVNNSVMNCPSAGTGCTTAGFRTETIGEGHLSKYHEIYGSSNVRRIGGATYKIIDSCEAEVLSKDGCVRQARQIVDPLACAAECERGRWPGSDLPPCAVICAPSINVPWYARDPEVIQADDPATPEIYEKQYRFPALEDQFVGVRSLGIQPGSINDVDIQDRLMINNDLAMAKSTVCIAWEERVSRRYSYEDKPLDYDMNSMPDPPVTPITQTIQTMPKDDTGGTQWTTPW